MKSFELKALGLEELYPQEVKNTNGGGVIAGFIIALVVGAIVDAILDPEAAQSDFERGREDARELIEKI